jgi:CheY-like chemotaxis protein
LVETKDFYQFKFMPIHGENAQNKGMALFPRKVNGKYAMLSRLDGINNYIMFSDDINLWDKAEKLQGPKFPWEFIQIGNCGSPIETEYGWLVVTHGVGTMRKYCLGVSMLDLEDPTKVIGQLSEPLLAPNEEEREGYVPNVVYSCGAIINNDELVIPYAMSDTASTFASIPLEELYSRLIPSRVKGGKKKLTKDADEDKTTRILIVDDDALMQRVVGQILTQEGYEVEIAPDGVVALMQISKEPFDLILSDISMPNLDGYQLLEYMNKNNIEIPVVFMSGHSDRAAELKGLEMGAAEYIAKPISKDLLLLRLKNILKR